MLLYSQVCVSRVFYYRYDQVVWVYTWGQCFLLVDELCSVVLVIGAYLFLCFCYWLGYKLQASFVICFTRFLIYKWHIYKYKKTSATMARHVNYHPAMKTKKIAAPDSNRNRNNKQRMKINCAQNRVGALWLKLNFYSNCYRLHSKLNTQKRKIDWLLHLCIYTCPTPEYSPRCTADVAKHPEPVRGRPI